LRLGQQRDDRTLRDTTLDLRLVTSFAIEKLWQDYQGECEEDDGTNHPSFVSST
jgi:hypothetical protein